MHGNIKSRGEWMQTYTGLAFYPLDPRPEEIRIADISAALSKTCRYGGHCVKFYSVAEHCVHIASMAPDHLKLTALLHDASEAYLGDMVRPLKREIPQYQVIEEHLERVIAEKYGTTFPLPPEIKSLDNRILMDERGQNLAAPSQPWRTELEPLGVELRYWSHHQASYEFMVAFYRYGGRDS